MLIKSQLNQLSPYITLDQSEILEIMHPTTHGNSQQSLAQARVKPGQSTQLHKHKVSEELYFITQGMGELQLDEQLIPVETGDCICIKPSMAHCIKNTGSQDLIFLCCCAPAYSHNDTELL